MAGSAMRGVVLGIERLFGPGGVTALGEGHLLERYVTRRDDAAFEAIVARHGPMVRGVCRRLLRDPNDVDDAFQATFLVLARKAKDLRDRDLLGNWLYGVAYKVATRARSDAAKRHANETPTEGVGGMALAREGPAVGSDDAPALLDEVNRLPEKYRTPVVLCYLEGLTHEEAAERLNWPVGTVKGRLSRARDQLRTRLTRRGVTLASAAEVGDRLAPGMRAALPEVLVQSTVKAASLVAAGQSVAGVGLISAQALALSEGVFHAMTLTKLKAAVATLAVAASLATGVSVFAYQLGGAGPEPEKAQRAVGTTEKFKVDGRKATLPQTAATPPAAQPQGVPNAGAMAGGGGGFAEGVDPPLTVEQIEDRNRLRVLIAELSSALQSEDKSAPTQEVLKKLGDRVSMSFPNPTPLEDVLKYIKQASAGPNSAGIPIYVDPRGLEDAEKTLASPVSMDLEGVALKTTLRLLLKQLGLAYCVKDGLVIISSPAGILDELRESEIATTPAESRVPSKPNPNPGGFR